MTIYWCSPTGDDTNAGSLSAPFATLTHAAGVVVAGDTVRALPGVYNEAVHITTSGSNWNSTLPK